MIITETQVVPLAVPAVLSAETSLAKPMAPSALVSTYHDGRENLTGRMLVAKALRARIESIDHDVCEAGGEDAFFVADLGEVYRQHLRWKLNLPRIEPFYGEHHIYIRTKWER